MKKLYKFYWDCGRMGHVEGIFISTEEEIKENLGEGVIFGEILGKHSNVSGILEESDLTVLTDDQDFINKLEKYLGGYSFGYNPLAYLAKDMQ